jgi:hypothetical protein
MACAVGGALQHRCRPAFDRHDGNTAVSCAIAGTRALGNRNGCGDDSLGYGRVKGTPVP